MFVKLKVREAEIKKGANVYLREGSRFIQYAIEAIDHPVRKTLRHPAKPWEVIPGTSKEVQKIHLKKRYSSIRKSVIIGEDPVYRKKGVFKSKDRKLSSLLKKRERIQQIQASNIKADN